MTKNQIIKEIIKETGLPKNRAAKMFSAFTETVGEALKKGEKVTISGFGTFLPSQRREREGVSPLDSKKRITIPEHTVPRFKPSQQLKVRFNK